MRGSGLLVRLLLPALVLVGLMVIANRPGSAASAPGKAAAPSGDGAQESSQPRATRDDDIERFQPSEEVPADSAVSFPVDI